MKKKNIILCCPNCHSRKVHFVITERKFSLNKAMTGGIVGGIIGGHSLGLFGLMGIDAKEGGSRVQCDVCKHVWRIKKRK